jgi:hypothetical protein
VSVRFTALFFARTFENPLGVAELGFSEFLVTLLGFPDLAEFRSSAMAQLV